MIKKASSAIFKTLVLSLMLIADLHFAFAQSTQQGIIPNGKATFLDQNGKPLTAGTVDFYIPGTTTRKTTYQDIGGTTPNTNPVVLDAAGRALLWGNGNYRQVVKDKNQNLIWDVTTTVNGGGGGGGGGPTVAGDGDLVGTIKPYAGMTAPNQYMFTYGQELSRTTYITLFNAITSTQGAFCTTGSATLTGIEDTTNFWVGMKVEVNCVSGGITTVVSKTANSVTLALTSNITTNTNATFFSWGNGNGSTTFNLPDFRGVVPVGNNIMGGVASSNLTTTYFGATNPNSSGALGGGQSMSLTLLTANLPPYTPAGTVSVTSTVSNVVTSNAVLSSNAAGGTNNQLQPPSAIGSITSTGNLTGTPQGGTNVPITFSLVQPSKTVNYIIKVTPDAIIPTFTVNLDPFTLLGNPNNVSAPPQEIQIDPTLSFNGTTLQCSTATNLQNGCVKPDGTTITVNGTGTLTAIGAVTASIDAAGATSITNGTSNCILYDNAGTVGCNVNPVNLYVSPSGNDSNTCLSVGVPCLTISHAISIATKTFNLAGAQVKINLAAGTYTKGVIASGIIPGQANIGSGFTPMITIIGAGSASTLIDPSTNCASGVYGVYASDGIIIGLGSVKITTNCANGSGLSIQNGARIFLADNDVNFAGAVDAIIRVGNNASFDANYIGPKSFTISSGAQYAFAGSGNAYIVTGAGVTNFITNTPTFSLCFLSLIDGAFYNEGISSTWSGTASGLRYCLAGGANADREQSIQTTPGSLPGTLQGLSRMYSNGLVAGVSIDKPCVGGSAGCRNTTAPTGLGSGGAASMLTGSGDHGGVVTLATGTGPSTSGSVVVAPVSILTGDYGAGGSCVVSLNNIGATWPSGSMVQSWFDTNGIHITWSGSVVASASYNISYICN